MRLRFTFVLAVALVITALVPPPSVAEPGRRKARLFGLAAGTALGGLTLRLAW